MPSLPEPLLLTVSLCALLAAAHLVGGLFQRLHQPRVMGEIAGGLLLGPTVLGAIAPHLHQALFVGHDGLRLVAWVGLILLMACSGLEAREAPVHGEGRIVAFLVVSGTAIPLAAGFGLSRVFDFSRFHGPNATSETFGLLLAMAIAVTALPVLSRMLRDLGLAGTAFMRVALTVALVEDLILWVLLSAILALSGVMHANAWAIVAFLVGRGLTWVGLIPDRVRTGLSTFGFATVIPLFFAGVGLSLDLWKAFDFAAFVGLLVLACSIKTASVFAGACLAGQRPGTGLHLAIALNARGAVGIVLAQVALDAGLISRTFDAILVLIALVSTQLAGSWLHWIKRFAPDQLILDPEARDLAPE